MLCVSITHSICFGKDIMLPFSIFYQKLNAITMKWVCPIPWMKECIYTLSEAKIFSTKDCNSVYWCIPIDKQDRNKMSKVSDLAYFDSHVYHLVTQTHRVRFRAQSISVLSWLNGNSQSSIPTTSLYFEKYLPAYGSFEGHANVS